MLEQNNRRSPFGPKSSVCSLVIALAVSSVTQAAPRYWDGGDGSWGTAANWDVGVPGTGDEAVFNVVGNNNINQTVTLDGSRTVQALTFNNAGTTQINSGSGGTLTVNNGGASLVTLGTGSGAVTIAPATDFGTSGSGGSYVFSINGDSLTFNGLVSTPRTGNRTWEVNGGTVNFAGGFQLDTGNNTGRVNTIKGSGTLILSGATNTAGNNPSLLGTDATFTGTLRLNAPGYTTNYTGSNNTAITHRAGTVEFANNTSLPASGLFWQGGKLAAFGASQTISQAVKADGTGATRTFEISGSQDLTFTNLNLAEGTGASTRTLNVTNSGLTTFAGSTTKLNDSTSGAVDWSFNASASRRLLVTSNLTTDGGATNLQVGGLGVVELTGSGNQLSSTTVSAGTLLVNNTTGSATGSGAVAIAADAKLRGSGTISGAISGAGSVHAGNSPGILTVGQTNPAAGMDFFFEFTQAGAPTWSNATASGNDVLRIINVATPFAAALGASNEINVYFNNTGTFLGGFFVQDALSDFTTDLASATFNYYIAGTGVGSVTYNGNSYLALSSANVTRSVVDATANFAGGSVDGRTQQFVVVPEPGSMTLAMMAGFAGLVSFRKRRG